MGANQVIILMGPTASGKSGLAMDVAQQLGGTIINADSMQVYRDLRIITARPDDAAMANVPHRLYGVLDAAVPCQVAMWVEMAEGEIREAWNTGRVPILVGGTGMYIKALMYGIADIPPVDVSIRAMVRHKLEDEGNEAFHDYLTEIDPVMGRRLKPGDTQRMLRAAEVVEQTGISLSEWQKKPMTVPLPKAEFTSYAVDLAREGVYARIDARFAEMVEAGAIEEVAELKARGLPAHLPVMRAHGVPELMAYLDGEMSLDEAVSQAQTNTRRYAKRQWTWLRHQMPGISWIHSAEELLDRMLQNS